MPTVDISQDFSSPSTGGASAYGFEDIDVAGGGPHDDLRLMTVASGVARASAVNGDCLVRCTTDMGSPDHYAEADVIMGASVANQYTGVKVRMSGTPGVWTWYKMEVWGSSTQVRLICLVNGVTRGEWYASQTIATNTTYTFKLEAVGTRLRGWVNGVLKFDVTDSNITSNTRTGFNIACFNGSTSHSGITAFRAQNFLTTSDPGGSAPSGAFTINSANGRIIDPNGNWFKPTGFNAPSRPYPAPVSESYWANQTYATGQSTAAQAWGINMMRFILWSPAGSAEVTRETQIQGLFRAIDEYIDKGIVCTWWAGDFTGANPTVAQLAGSFPLEIMDRVIAQYKTHPRREYIWLNPLNEPFEFLWTDGVTGAGFGWSTVWTWLYDRARAAGWDAMFLVDLPGYANGGILRVLDSTIVETFLAGKTKTVISWHNYGLNGDQNEMTSCADAAVSKKIPLIIGEFGQHWNASSQNALDAAGVDWVKNNAWTYGFGGLAWQGSGEPGMTFAPRLGDGTAFWQSTPGLSEMGQVIYDRGTGGGVGGGPPEEEPPPPVVVNPPVVVSSTSRRRQTRGRLSIGGAGGTVYGGRPRP